MAEKALRSANVEMLRCLLMFLIVADHCYYHGIFKDSQAAWTALFTTFVMWHVDCFVGISGWFGIKFSLKKFWKIYSQVLFYSILSFGYLYFFDRGNFSLAKFSITGGWFGGTYLFLMLIAPLLNLMIEKLVTLPRKEILLYWGLFAGGIILAWIPGHLLTAIEPKGLDDGYSIIMFVFLYLTARLMSTTGLHPPRNCCLLAMGGGIAIIIALACFQAAKGYVRGLPIDGSILRVYHSYSAPHIWILAIAVLVYFARYVNVSGRFATLVRFCSPSMFAIYLLHDTTSFGSLIYRAPETWLAANTSLHPSLIIFLCAVLTFIVCLAADTVRRGIFKVLRID